MILPTGDPDRPATSLERETDPSRVAHLFAGHRHFDIALRAALAGKIGTVWRVRRRIPAAAAVAFDDLVYFGGDGRSDDARRLLSGFPARCAMIVPDRVWRLQLGRCFPYAIRLQAWWSFDRWIAEAPRARRRRPSGLVVQRLDASEMYSAPPGLVRAVTGMHGTPARFLETGFGHAASLDGEIVGLAGSLCREGERVEVAVATDWHCRREGVAAATLAAFLDECGRRGLRPHWTAADIVSCALARHVGFRDPVRFLTYWRIL